jgi:pimeloyl-ACP methyl ester carboxylesterase
MISILNFMLPLLIAGVQLLDSPAQAALTPHSYSFNLPRLVCHDLFAIPAEDMAKFDKLTRIRHEVAGGTVKLGEIKINGRKDWRVNYEFISGDPKQPLIVLINGFKWPRENTAPLITSILQQEYIGGPGFNILRYDMSGQGKTLELFKPTGPAPWYMNEPLTLEKLRNELTQVVHDALAKNGLPSDHPIILFGLSYGRALLPRELMAQTKSIFEVTALMRSTENYNNDSAAWRAYLGWMRLNPLTASSAEVLQIAGWRQYYDTYYSQHPDAIPKKAVDSWYRESSVLRSNAITRFDANNYILEGIPTFVFVAELDTPDIKIDQINYFRRSLAKKSPAFFIHARGVGHGMADFDSAKMISALMATILAHASNMIDLPLEDRVVEGSVIDGKVRFKQININDLLKDIKEKANSN